MSGANLPEGLDVIEPEPVRVPVGDGVVELRPLTVGKLPAFARALRPMAGAFERFDLEALDARGVLDLLVDHGEQILEAVSIATGIARARVDACDHVQLVGLIAGVIKVNADFFGRSLRPLLAQARAVEAGDGRTPSRH
ncbi:MAG TPA: hypothetical protein VNV16_14925 [Methylibium sp.]|nr:hypothetical protein [Methylibium sp.]